MGTIRRLLIPAVILGTLGIAPVTAHASTATHDTETTATIQTVSDHPAMPSHRHHHHQHHDHWAWMRGEALEWAMSQAGKPYEWGETGPNGYDCSGLVYAAYRHMRHSIPRDTYGMLAALGGRLRVFHGKRPPRGALAFFGSGHVELLLNWRKHLTFGAEAPGTNVGRHRWSQWWHPTLYVVVI